MHCVQYVNKGPTSTAKENFSLYGKCKENIIIMYQSYLIYLGKLFRKKSLDRKICFNLKS